MIWRRHVQAVAVLLFLAACSPDEPVPPPREPDSTSIAYFCHMSLPEHEGPKGQIFLAGQDEPIWFASVHEVFVYLDTEDPRPNELRAVYVNDMSQGSWEHPAPGAWIEARKAFYVIGSSRGAAMGGTEAVPFSTRPAAEGFMQSYGGRVEGFADARKDLSPDATGGSN